ncbi:MAG: isoleucine--tRNA ligase [Planctomycetes bacterium]|nr:isoleucine--tRNA ligase [Planctomycetota bacterium]
MTADRTKPQPYPEVQSQPDFPAIERAILASWEREGTFAESVRFRPAGERGGNEYVFYDGPPFANGLPHYGHLLTGYVKDVVPRYQTMRGKRVERRFGWDCHGLPAEMEAEKQLGISGRKAITEFGIDRFNATCRASVMKYTADWRSYVTRQARWVDFDNDYKTMDLSYMESVMWAFKRLWEKGLVYEGFKVMPYSWAAETPLSNFETRLDNSYRVRQDPALTVAFRLLPREGDGGPIEVLAWTTTPWTLPSNLALAVGPELEYVLVEKDGRRLLLASAALPRYAKELAGHTVLRSLPGRELVGRRYEPLFPYFAGHANAFVVLAGDFVSTEDGSGVVHMAPGFGEDDQRVCEANGIALVVPVDDTGRFTAQVTDWAGLNVFEANNPITDRLKETGRLFKRATIDHNYPHCWRTDQPLIYRALNSWYVKVTDFKDRMLELNREIRWIPERIRDGQFGKWLENARDWSISRNRFWGTPIPVWRSDDPRYPRIDVYGSIAELERDFGVKVTDLHRPFIDELVRRNPDDPSGRSMMRRVPEVLDCWFESGSMPFAQIHYPFENKDWFEHHFPADFIVEYVAQTRGWFYTLVVLGTALFDRPPFRNVICHGVVLDADGQKLSKKLRNYHDPQEVCETIGADALRWFLMASPILTGGDLRIEKDGKSIQEVVRLVVNPIWNAYAFFVLYANADGYRARFRTDSQRLLDRYLIGKTRELVLGVQAAMDGYDIALACHRVTAFLDAMNNWYIRRSRARFWGELGEDDRNDAYDTLYSVLVTLCRCVAPLLPLLGEAVYRGLTGERSVHLSDWPEVSGWPEHRELRTTMDRVRDACSAALSLREQKRLRIRLPLRSLTIAGADTRALSGFAELIRDELNVKEVVVADDMAAYGGFQLMPNSPVLGPKLGADMKKVMSAARSGDWKANPDGSAVVGGVRLEPGEFQLRLVPKDGVTSAPLSTNDAVVVLDTAVTPELEREGLARDLVRLIQQTRKDAGLHVSDRIALWFEFGELGRAAFAEHRGFVLEQVLGASVDAGAAPSHAFRAEGTLGSESVVLRLAKV